MKYLLILFITIYSISINSQNIVPNGGFEKGTNSSCFDVEIPCRIGYVPKNSAPVFKWHSFGSPNNSFTSNSSVFDSRFVCTDYNNPDPCECYWGSECNLEKYQVGIPSNLFGTQNHRLPINGVDILGRYVGIQTKLAIRNGIKVKLLEPIECGVNYELEMFCVKKKGSTVYAHVRFSEDGNWNNPIPYNASGHIDYDVEITETSNWQQISQVFDFQSPSSSPVWMMIRISKNGTQQGRFLIDDVSLTKIPCNPDKKCSSTTDCIDVQVLDHVADADHSSLVFHGLEEVTNLNLNIYALNGQLIRNYNIDNPSYSWEWDGVNQYGGTLSSATYSYDYTLSNDCQSVSGSGTTVKINLGNRIFNVYAGGSEAGLTFYNLDNVQNMTLEILTTSGALLFTETFVNPPNSLAWSGLYNNGNHPAPGNYDWRLSVSNNCGSAVFSDNFSFIDFSEPHILHDHTPIAKPALYNCGDDKDYSIYQRDYDRAPLPCCEFEPDIYLDNVNIWYDTKYKATNNITIGNNVRVIGNNSGVLFQAGNSITVLPGAEIADATLLELTFCVKSATYHGDDEPNYTEELEVNTIPVVENNISKSQSLFLYPNPASESFLIKITSNKKGFDLKVVDIHGKNILNLNSLSNTKSINTSNWSKGIYICEISYDEIVEVKKLIIK